MKYSRRNRQLAMVLMISSLFFSACSILTTRVSEKDVKSLSEARELISILNNQNLELKTFKGVGRIRFWENDKKDLPTRVAWIGSAPDRLRIVLRSVSGQPVVSFANDGQWLYLFSHAQGRFYKQRSKNSTMKRFFSMPIKSNNVVNILAGRVPVNEYNSAVVIKNKQLGRSCPGEADRPENGYVLVLKRRWGNISEKIYLDANKKGVCKVEVFDLTGALAYRVEFNRMQSVDGYKVPSRLVFTNDDGLGFQLDVDKYWADVSVSQSMFILTPPEQEIAN